jgi:flagellar motor switch protein FliG
MKQEKFTEQIARLMQTACMFREKAKKEGLDTLRNEINADVKRQNDLFEYGILLCVNGMEPARLEEILSNLINIEHDKEKKRLKTIQKEAVLQIQKGVRPSLLLNALFSHLYNNELEEVRSFLCPDIYKEFEKLLKPPYTKQEVIDDTLDTCGDDRHIRFFDFLRSTEPALLLDLIQQEQPQTKAYILAFIEPEKASYILQNLPSGEQSDIMRRIAVMDQPSLELLTDVLRLEKKFLTMSGKSYTPPDSGEFSRLLKTYLVSGKKISEALELYKQASKIPEDSQEAVNFINNFSSVIEGTPFDFLETSLYNFLSMLQEEHPKTIAYIFSFIHPFKAALLLQYLPRNIQSNVMFYIAFMDSKNTDILCMQKKLSAMSNKDCVVKVGLEKIIELLKLTDRVTERHIIETFEDEDPELAKAIKENLFVFEGIVMLDDRAVQSILRETDIRMLTFALYGASDKVQERVFKNISKRAAVMLKENIECMGQVNSNDVKESQQGIISIIRHLEETGELVITRHNQI